MQYRRLGRSGLQVSALSFGSWVTFGSQIDDGMSDRLLSMAYEAGINFFDNAEAYASGHSEEVMGQILAAKDWDRSSYVVSSKVFWGGDGPNRKGLMRKHVVEACHAALKRLRVDYLDLFFCHRPDVHTPIEETVWTMHNLIQQGKILYWGTSEWTAQQITEAHLVARANNLIGPTMEQPQYNMFVRRKMEAEFRPLFDRFGLGTTIWSPLASGFLTGKYLDGVPKGSRLDLENMEWLRQYTVDDQAKMRKAAAIRDVASDLGVPMAQLAIAWCLKNPDVSTVLLGATRPAQLTENLGALDVVDQLSDDVMERLEEILGNKPTIQEY